MNYYEILHISPSSSLKNIKKAYRKLALLHHPDKNNNSEESTELFKQISIAYQVLSDPIQRSYYDNTGNADIDFDLLSSLELFKIFFKDYDPKLVTIIEKTYGRIQEELKDNQTDSLLRVIYNIEKADIIKDASHLAVNYLSDYISQYMTTSKGQSSPTQNITHHTYHVDDLLSVTTITLPIEYYIHYKSIDISIVKDTTPYTLTLDTFFSIHNITFQNKHFTFSLEDKPNSIYKRINQHDIVMSCNIGMQDYIKGFQFSYNYIHTFIDTPILLSKYSSCIVIFKNLGLPKHKTENGNLIIEFLIQSNIERLYRPPLHNDFMYSTSLKNLF